MKEMILKAIIICTVLVLFSCKTTIYKLNGEFGTTIYEVKKGKKMFFIQPGLQIINNERDDLDGIGFHFEDPKIKLINEVRDGSRFQYRYSEEERSDTVKFVLDSTVITSSKTLILPHMLFGSRSYPCNLNRIRKNLRVDYKYVGETNNDYYPQKNISFYKFDVKIYKSSLSSFYTAKIYIEKETLMPVFFEIPTCNKNSREQMVQQKFDLVEIKKMWFLNKNRLWQ